METDTHRRRLLQTALAATAALNVVTNRAFAASDGDAGRAASPQSAPVPMIQDLMVRIPDGKLAEWSSFWGTQYVPALEKSGQRLWGAWSSLTGQQNAITHQWVYRDLAHVEAQSKIRATDPDVAALSPRQTVRIQETLHTCMATPISYHPANLPSTPNGEVGIIATHRISTVTTSADGPTRPREHASAATQYVAVAAKHGAQLMGAFQSSPGWYPNYILQVWRYSSLAGYLAAREAIEADAAAQRLLAAMREIYPHESVALHRPLSYSRVR